jgi:hypothetical protein
MANTIPRRLSYNIIYTPQLSEGHNESVLGCEFKIASLRNIQVSLILQGSSSKYGKCHTCTV